VRAARDLAAGTRLEREMLDVLRPAPRNAILPFELEKVVGRRVRCALEAGEALTWGLLEEE
jgi:N-acetylneuraminate synthase